MTRRAPSDPSHEIVCVGADALLFAQTGACRFGRVCGLCDCPAAEDEEYLRARDGWAYDHALAVLRAASHT